MNCMGCIVFGYVGHTLFADEFEIFRTTDMGLGVRVVRHTW